MEEDLTRTLPPSERVTHAILALNYGAILALVCPLLVDWSVEETALAVAYQGFWSIFAGLASIAVACFGLRDLLAGARTHRLTRPPAGPLVEAISGQRRILVTGGTGFIGRRLVSALIERGHAVTILTRDKVHAAALPAPIRIVTDLGQIRADERIDSIVNLAGEPVTGGLWTPRRRREIVASRLRVTDAVVDLIARLDVRPDSLISGSAVGWYGLRDDEILDEAASPRDCFLHRVCDRWEESARRAEGHGVRVVYLRTGLVLGVEDGLLSRLLVPFEFGLGGPIGSGLQWMPWIALDDVVRLIACAIADPGIRGPLNAIAPRPVRNRDFAAALAAALRRPGVVTLPAAPLRLLLGDFADELFLSGQRVVPTKALASGFEFRQPDIRRALDEIVGRVRQPGETPATENSTVGRARGSGKGPITTGR